ncbi:hypothetical protein [Culicoidibacter larvae]|nr:hypothetical protein [Culicoidibacter larvae]
MSDDIIVAIIGAIALVITTTVTAVANYYSAKQKNYRQSRSSKKR